MAIATKLRKGTCKLCGKTYRRPTAGELIKAIHAHYIKVHPGSLSRKIKRGMRKAKASTGLVVGNPLSMNWIGFAERPLIEKVTGLPYEQVRAQVLDFLVSMLLGGISRPKA